MEDRTNKSKRRRRGADSGATAVEFAMVVGPLLLIIFATLELAMVFVVSTMVESALSKGAREIRTGQQQNGADVSEAAFKGKICDEMVFLEGHCATHLSLDVRASTQFTMTGAPDPAEGGSFDDSDLTFNPGGPSQIILVRAFYRWPLLTPFLEQALGDVDGNTALIISADTFRNEPF
jgi:Flp pilus assembly protein TadG